jgi:hypothetical protein
LVTEQQTSSTSPTPVLGKTEFRIRWAYVILAAFTVLLVLLSLIFNYQQAQKTEQKFRDAARKGDLRWCQLINASLPSKAPVPPKDPKLHPDQEKLYRNYRIVYQLGEDLGCYK